MSEYSGDPMRLTLQGRLLAFLLLPVALISLATLVYGFVYARECLITQWIGKANANLENAAREIGCRLKERLRLVDAIANAEDIPYGNITQAYLVQILSNMKGVKFVNIERVKGDWSDKNTNRAAAVDPDLQRDPSNMEQNVPTAQNTVELRVNTDHDFLDIVSTFRVKDQPFYKRLTVVADFSSLIEEIKKLELWKGCKALLVDSEGLCLAHTDPKWVNQTLGKSGHPLEKRILVEMKTRDSGTFFGEGRPPDLVMGFHRIPSTNWYLVLYSEGCEICRPMLRFRFPLYYR